MLRLLKSKKAQNTMEYALLIAIVIGAFTAMQVYVKRGMQARLRSGTDNIPAMIEANASLAKGALFGQDAQYEPYYIRQGNSSIQTTSTEGQEKGTITEAGGLRELANATSARTGNYGVTGAVQNDTWATTTP